MAETLGQCSSSVVVVVTSGADKHRLKVCDVASPSPFPLGVPLRQLSVFCDTLASMQGRREVLTGMHVGHKALLWDRGSFSGSLVP